MKRQRILITGGTGTFGLAFARHCLAAGATRVVIYARHEKEMFDAEMTLSPADTLGALRPIIGDVRDLDRLEMAMRDVDIVVHAAALKRIEQCERDPLEAVATNVVGSANVVKAALRTHVQKAVLLSTDKAVHPVNLYGATKLTAERLFLAANNLSGGRCSFSVARYGNIWGSRGSVVHVWRERIAAGKRATITHPDATRYFMRRDEAVKLVNDLITMMRGGETALPVLPAYALCDLAEAMGITAWDGTGLPQWEKPHETLDGVTDSSAARRMSVTELRAALREI
jgi:UDP-N-acetylglucosamine 4,6-dehydratase/5-epimerase